MDVEAIRQQIPTLQHSIYMNTGWSGPPPAVVNQAIKDRLDYESELGPASPEVLETSRELKLQAREAAAGLLNASVDEICLTQNTTHGMAIVVGGLPWEAGDEVITFDMEHNAVKMPALNLERRHGVNTIVLPLASNETADSIANKVDQAITERTRLVFFSHIQYSSGLRMPLEAIREITSRHGVWMLVDGAQTPGHIDLDMEKLGVDFYSIPGQKWLLGPQGTGALYIRESAIPLVEPVLAASQFLSGNEETGDLEPHNDLITKFNLGTTSPALAAGFKAAIEFIRGVGTVEIEERTRKLALYLKMHLAEMPGITVHSPLDRATSSGLVTFGVSGVVPEEGVANLWERHHIAARRVLNPLGLRVALDFFNTEEEIDAVCDAVQELSEGR